MFGIKRRLAHLTAALVLVFGLAAVPLQTPVGELFGPASAEAACNNFTIYAGANKDSWAWASCADDGNLSGNREGISPSIRVSSCHFVATGTIASAVCPPISPARRKPACGAYRTTLATASR